MLKMIDQSITLPDISTMLTVVTLGAGLWYRVETRVSAVSKDALQKAEDAIGDLAKFKLEVSENYARNGFIRDVEDRLGKRFDAIVDELHGMRTDFHNAIMAASKPNSRSRQ